jgi:hypothetical protein
MPANDSLSMIDAYIDGTSNVLPDTITSNIISTFKYCTVMLSGHFLLLNLFWMTIAIIFNGLLGAIFSDILL